MLKIADLLDKSKACAGIDSDYRLAKIIGITHSAITNYRSDRSLPDEKVIQKLCEMSGDDPDVISALFQSRRARTEEGRVLWMRVAQRLMSGATSGIAAATLSGCLWVDDASAALASPNYPLHRVCILCKVAFGASVRRLNVLFSTFVCFFRDVQNEKACLSCA